MDIKSSLVFVFAVCNLSLYCGQEKSIDTVYIFDNQMNKVKLFHKVNSLIPADIQKNSSNLSEVLRFQSPVYIKENGRGAVSSPSFRGTTAQQTAFVWNGININSQFLGQGDVNNIALFGYDQMEIKSGGGSVIYGSGAIGGSIHLNNNLGFNEGLNGAFNSEIASFRTYNNFLKASFSNEKFSFKATASHAISQNEYEVPESRNYINRNGKYYNTNFNFAAAYKIAPFHQISWISEIFDGNQHYPVFFESQTQTKYETQNLRSLLSWDWKKSKFNNILRAAYTEENFQYFATLNQPRTSGGAGKNYIVKNDFNYFINPKWNINLIGEFQHNQAEGIGTSGIGDISRNIASAAGLLRYMPSSKIILEAGIKKDFVEGFDSPVLYSFSGKWKAANWYQFNLNLSKNFRFPSFNDLYWAPGGNPNLVPETSIQADMNHEFKAGDFKLVLSPYYIRIKDMLRWMNTPLGYWSPFNTDQVESFGLESQLTYQKQINQHHLKINAGYIFTKSKDLEINKQLMYVPLHKIFGNVDYNYRFIRIYAQGMFNGLTYTESNEKKSDALQPYFVMNAGISATIMKKYTVGFKINNIFDEIYETTAYYPLPKRNYSINFNINF
ncbi:TonB-dependent receptor [Chryseobacterium chendengshani]|uniref:TonB-dependent receptor plug domain-containing protein n=1 Tax=Chryseobacterium sp. LJ668 TaxID=2864040 RepID=UPI001C68D413|nr:TonB-dependent receptor [Chryseobacterium sp. LJ668]MBW8523270.1 TonB-dependent receptor [Chryseobacterium sp. LJ668]QYK15563.1 TonB-dependent receptor [Chryseobacterium sp. LJ668]